MNGGCLSEQAAVSCVATIEFLALAMPIYLGGGMGLQHELLAVCRVGTAQVNTPAYLAPILWLNHGLGEHS